MLATTTLLTVNMDTKSPSLLHTQDTAPKALMAALMLIVLLGSVLLSSNSHAGNVYRWKDSSGSVHYGENPPRGVDATLLNTTTGKSSKSRRNAPNETRVEPGQYTGDNAVPEQNKEPVTEQEIVKPKKDEGVCKRARYNLKVLNERSRIRQTDENGEERFLTEEEKNEQKSSAQSAIDTYCP